jgi:hypothetical protein
VRVKIAGILVMASIISRCLAAVASERWAEKDQQFGEIFAMSSGLKYELQTDVEGKYGLIEAKDRDVILYTFPALVVQGDRRTGGAGRNVVVLRDFMMKMNTALKSVLGAAGLVEREEQSLKESHLVEVTTLVPPRPSSDQASLIGAGSGFYKNQFVYSDCYIYLMKFARMVWAGEIYCQRSQLYAKEEAVPITKLVVNVSATVFIMAHILKPVTHLVRVPWFEYLGLTCPTY